MPKRYFQDTLHSSQVNEKINCTENLSNRPISRCRNLVSRFEQLRHKLCTSQYYDPYQKEQQIEEEKITTTTMTDDDDDDDDERPAKRHRSVVSAVVDNVVHGVLYGAAAAYEYLWVDKLGAEIIKGKMLMASYHNKKRRPSSNPKMMRGVGVDFNCFDQSSDLFQKRQKSDQSYRDIFYKTQQAANIKKKTSIDNCYFTFDKKKSSIDEDWGVIDKTNYKADFPSTTPNSRLFASNSF